MPTRRLSLVLLILSILVTLALYGGALSLPLYMDDIIFGRYTEQVSLAELFTRADLVPYYRPLSLAPWKLLQMATGGFDPVWMHAFNLIVHALNGWLTGLLAARLLLPASALRSRRALYGGTAALLYLLFPFSYQAVGWAAALGHLMAALGALIAALALLAWHGHRRPISLALIPLGTAVSVFSHENGAIVPVLLSFQWAALSLGFPNYRDAGVRTEPFRLKTEHVTSSVFPLVPSFLIVGVFALIWSSIPLGRDGIAVSAADWLANGAYFAQGLGYPVAQAGAWVWQTFGLPREAVAATLGLVGGLAALLLAGRRGLIGAGWYVLAVAVPTLFLQRAYAIDGPRLMLLASVGAALLWTAAVGGLAERLALRRPRMIGPAAAVGLLMLIVLPCVTFIAGRMALHRELDRAYDAMFDYAKAHERSVFVNVPAWLAYRDERFALGSEGITYMTDYIGFRDLVYLNTSVWRETEALSVGAVLPEAPAYWYDVVRFEDTPENAALRVRTAGAGFVLNRVGDMWVWEAAWRGERGRAPITAEFANGITLSAARQTPAQRPQPVALNWRVAAPQSVTAFTHLLCEGALAAQSDGPPLRGLLTFDMWPPGEAWDEVRYVTWDGRAGCTLQAGLYDPLSGERITTRSGASEVLLTR